MEWCLFAIADCAAVPGSVVGEQEFVSLRFKK